MKIKTPVESGTLKQAFSKELTILTAHLGHIRRPALRSSRHRRLTRLTTFHAALSTKIKILRLITRTHSISSLLTSLTRLLTTLLFTKLRNRQAHVLNILRIQHSPIRTHKQANFSRQDTRLNVFNSLQNLIPKLLPTYLQTSRLQTMKRHFTHK